MNNNIINVAIDGPAGAGKHRRKRCGKNSSRFISMSIPALYQSDRRECAQETALIPRIKQRSPQSLDGVKVNLVFENGEQKVMLNGEDVSIVEIRTPGLQWRLRMFLLCRRSEPSSLIFNAI